MKRILTVILCIIILFSALSCSDNSKNSKVNQKNNVSTITVVDCIGRKVEIPSEVKRIGCLYAFSGHVVTMLGKGNHIVAVANGLKRDKLMMQLQPSIQDAYIPFISGSVNIEELVKADPDIVFIQSSTAMNDGEVAKLNQCHIPYLVISYHNMKEQQYAIEMIGKAVGALDKAKKYNQYYQNCIDKVEERVSDIPENQKIKVYHSINEAVRTDTKNTLAADWIKAAGAVNVSVKSELKLIDNNYYCTLEQIYLWDPDVIIANEMGVAEYILKNEKWISLRAVKKKRVYQMPNGISRWGHPGSMETPLALLWTAKKLYPDKFTDLNMISETKKYYHEFFGLELDNDTIAKVLSGKGMRLSKQEAKKE